MTETKPPYVATSDEQTQPIECQFCKASFNNQDAYQIHLGIGAPAFHDCNNKEEMTTKGMTANKDGVWSIPTRLVKHANGWAHLNIEALEQETDLLNAVTDYVYHRHSVLTHSNVIGFSREDLERVLTDGHGYLVFDVEDVYVTEKVEQDVLPVWFVSATLYFHVDDGGETIEGSTDVYECYTCGDKWCIEWYSC